MTTSPEMKNEIGIAGRIKRRLELEMERQALLSIKERLDSLRCWTPAAQLSKVVDEPLSIVNGLEERLESKAIVAVVGGTGAGKSTLVNALCGKDGTVEEGHGRPTTRSVTALARTPGDANVLLEGFGVGELAVKHDLGFRFGDVVLVDTPDTDSSECAGYSGLLDRVLQRADALVCVFPAQDPKRRDNIVRLAEKVAKYQAEQVFIVLNQCDRIPEQELGDIRADFDRNIGKSWAKAGQVFLLSARSSLGKPDWSEGERPLHGTNEFDALCAAIAGLGGSHFADRRIDRARELRRETECAVRDYIRGCGDWDAVHGKLKEFEDGLVDRLVEQVADRLASRTGDLSALLYRNVSERWHGPIGTYLQLGLLVRSLASSLRYLNPLNWTGKAVARLKAALGGGRPEDGSSLDDSVSVDWDFVKGDVLKAWPGLGCSLVNDFRMSPDLLDGEKAVSFGDLEESLRRCWPRNLEAAIEKMAKAKSRPIAQVVAHLPLVAMAAMSLYEMLSSYLQGNYLVRDYYLHAGAILLLLWLLPSWLVQSRAGGSVAKIKGTMRKELESAKVNVRMLPVLQEIDVIKSLCEDASEGGAKG